MQEKETNNNLIAEYYSQHYEEIRTFVASRMQSAYETEDVVQTIFYRLLRTDKMITPITLPCLVYTIAKNLICDYWRRRQFERDNEHALLRGDGVASGFDDTEIVCSMHELNELLENGIAMLKDKQQYIYRLSIEGMPMREIASQLDMKYKKVERRLGIARKEMRQYMKRMLA